MPLNRGLDQLLDVLLSLLDKDVAENCKNCSQYFILFNNFVQKGFKACQLLFKHSAFKHMLCFLLGPSRQNNQVMYAMRELTGSLSVISDMVTYCCFCNEHFSLVQVLQIIKSQLETAPPHELKNIFQLLHEILVIEDPLQSRRLKFAFESEKGLLALMHQSNNVDSSRCYQCIKFLVLLAQNQLMNKKVAFDSVAFLQCPNPRHQLKLGTVQLTYATALLNEKEQSGSSNGSDGSPATENGDRTLRQ
eukprot:g47637.t1